MKSGLTQSELAARAGVSRKDVSEIENGRFRGGCYKLEACANALGFELTVQKIRRPQFEELAEIFAE